MLRARLGRRMFIQGCRTSQTAREDGQENRNGTPQGRWAWGTEERRNKVQLAQKGESTGTRGGGGTEGAALRHNAVQEARNEATLETLDVHRKAGWKDLGSRECRRAVG